MVVFVQLELLDLVEWIARTVRPNGAHRPMGGIHLILVGDVCQLPPVYVNEPTRFFFEAMSWSSLDMQPVILTKVR